jgi:acetyl esterase
MPLDPQAHDFLSRLAAANLPSIEEQTIEQARAQMDLSTRFLGKPPYVDRVENRTIAGPGGDLAIRLITPEGAGQAKGTLPIVVYYHGGGWVLGGLSSHENVCRALANASDAMVAIVDYRLAPEHRFPAAADDAYAALVWLSAHANEIGGDSSRIAVCGDSAGGNLAAVATLKARDQGGPAVAFQALAYPITDYQPDSGSYLECAEGYFLSRAEMLWYWDQYAPNLEDRKRPHAAPNRAEDLSNLPPALVVTAEYDVLRDEGETYARRLAEAGVPVKLSRYDGMIHGFLRRYPFFEQGRAAIEEIGAALREGLRVRAPR